MVLCGEVGEEGETAFKNILVWKDEVDVPIHTVEVACGVEQMAPPDSAANYAAAVLDGDRRLVRQL